MLNVSNSPLTNVVITLKAMGEKTQALQLIETFGKYAGNVQQFDEIAYLYNELKDYKNSISYLKKALTSTADLQILYSIRANLAKMYNHINDPKNSIIYSKANQSVLPDNWDTKMEIGFSYYLLGNYVEGEKIMREIASAQNVPEEIKNRVRYNLASYDMMGGKFKQGLRAHVEVGHKIGILPVVQMENVPVWNGFPKKGQKIIIFAEGGIGDEIIGIRYMKNLTDLGMIPVWRTNNKDLVEVFNRNGYKTISYHDDMDFTDYVQIQAFWLPVLLNLESNEVWNGTYLTPNPEYVEKWKKILPAGRKIAVKFYGNEEYDQDLHRSIGEENFNKLVFPIETNLISLQLEGVKNKNRYIDIGSQINNIEDTLAIISLCDLVITSCTSIVHMAGSMGINTMVCPPIAAYYTWLGKEGSSYFYGDNLKVVQQKEHKDWTSVMNKVQQLIQTG